MYALYISLGLSEAQNLQGKADLFELMDQNVIENVSSEIRERAVKRPKTLLKIQIYHDSSDEEGLDSNSQEQGSRWI